MLGLKKTGAAERPRRMSAVELIVRWASSVVGWVRYEPWRATLCHKAPLWERSRIQIRMKNRKRMKSRSKSRSRTARPEALSS